MQKSAYRIESLMEGIEMELILAFIANPIVVLVNFVITILASIIAIIQFMGKSKAIKALNQLKIEVNDSNVVNMGDKSQNFENNSGPVKIDNRG